MSSLTTKGRNAEPVLQFSIFVPNRMGRMLEIVRHLAQRQVHILAMSVLDTTDSTVLRVIVDDPDACREVLEKHDFAYTESPMVCVEIQDERFLQQVLNALLEAELNIHYLYPFLTRPNGRSALAISIEHRDVAVEALRSHQFQVLYQDDLSR
jgi:hypothetical protein